jgi:C4-dicarboxylate-specific signal transduction histidine kinase
MTLCFLQNFLLLIILTLSCFSLQSSRFRTRLSARKKLELTLNTAKREQTKDKTRSDQHMKALWQLQMPDTGQLRLRQDRTVERSKAAAGREHAAARKG